MKTIFIYEQFKDVLIELGNNIPEKLLKKYYKRMKKDMRKLGITPGNVV